MEIELLSLFPSYVNSPLEESILKRAIQKGLLAVRNTDIRIFSSDKWHRVDDRPFGGGPGMVLMSEPVSKAIKSVRRNNSRVIYLSPQGMPLTANLARELAKEEHLILLAGHYEGIDQRVIDEEVDLEVSIGDVVLTNGCLAALVLIDAVSRFIPGVLGDEESAAQDSFEAGLLDCPHYTKPVSYLGLDVPTVLRSGDHAAIALWRRQKQVSTTLAVRPDLIANLLERVRMPTPTVRACKELTSLSSTERGCRDVDDRDDGNSELLPRNDHQQIDGRSLPNRDVISLQALTFLSSNISELRSWYKKLFPVVDLEGELGFYCTIGAMTLSFLSADNSSWASLSISLSEKDLYRIRRNSTTAFPESILLDKDHFLVLHDPENRLLRFHC